MTAAHALSTRGPGGAGTWDAVVVGARVAGSSTALLLARAGLRVLVVDRARRGSDTVSTHALMRGGVLQLDRWGLLDRMTATGVPPVRRVTFHYGAERLAVSLKPYAGVDALYAPRRNVLDALLVDAAEEAGARFAFGAAAIDLVRDDAGRVGGVVLRNRAGTTWTECAPLVVGADGRVSLVADRVNAPITSRGNSCAAFAYGYWPAGELDGYHWHYGRTGAVGLSAGVIPTNDGLACVFVAGPPAAVVAATRRRGLAGGIHELLGLLDGDLRDLVAAAPVGSVRLFRGMPAQLRQAHGPGWALVGDAGWWKDPLSTYGITDALRDAELLAGAVVAGAGSPRSTEAALADYQAQRDRCALSMHPIDDRIASHHWDLAEVRRLLRALSSVMSEQIEAVYAKDAAVTRIA